MVVRVRTGGSPVARRGELAESGHGGAVAACCARRRGAFKREGVRPP
jgi:hypothetical protein